MELKHLSPKAREILTLPDEERIEHIKKSVFIPYATAHELLDEMEELLVHPKVNRMPNMLIVARSNNGKTEILKEFIRRHPPEERLSMDSISAPVLYIQSPPAPNEHLFLNKALQIVWESVKTNESADKKLIKFMNILKRIEVKVLLIDELNSLLAGSPTKQRFFMNMLKYISNELKISIVCAGTAEAQLALSVDEQLKSRFPIRIIPRWQWSNDFRKLLVSFEHVLPLAEPSNLKELQLAKFLYGLSEGVIGDLASILRSAAEYAIKHEVEKIDEEIVKNCTFVKRGMTEKNKEI